MAVGTIVFFGPSDILTGSVIVRYNSDGSLDNTFGSGGKVITHFNHSNGFEASETLNIQPDGKIIVGESVILATNVDMLLARYNSNGTIDSTFGSNGSVSADFGNSDYIHKTILKPDGKILTAGQSSGVPQALLIQYLQNGNRDSSFGLNGVALSPHYTGVNTNFPIGGLAIQADGKIVASGASRLGAIDKCEAVRFLSNGSIDSTYGDTGRARITLSGTANYVSLQQDGKAVLSGATIGNNHYQVCILRLNTNGLIDSSFGTNGIVLTDIDTSSQSSWQSFIQPDGKILLAGTNAVGGPLPNYPPNGYRGNFILFRYNSDGKLDSTFGVQGMITTDFGLQDVAVCLAIQNDGKVILGGRAADSLKFNLGFARYNFDALPLNLLSFTATRQGKINFLQWHTSHELNVKHFDIQRSRNEQDYHSIGTVRAGLNDYHFADEQPMQENNFYRLKMVDKDGKFQYSTVRIINNNSSFPIINFYPNPVTDKLQVQIKSVKEVYLNVQVLDMSGNTVYSTKWDLIKGTSVKGIIVDNLKSGTYFLKTFTPNNEKWLLKFEKL